MMYLLFAESQLCPPTRTRPGEGTIYSACIAYQQCKDRTDRSEEHTSELQSRLHLVCRLLLEKKKNLRISLRSVSSPSAAVFEYLGIEEAGERQAPALERDRPEIVLQCAIEHIVTEHVSTPVT